MQRKRVILTWVPAVLQGAVVEYAIHGSYVYARRTIAFFETPTGMSRRYLYRRAPWQAVAECVNCQELAQVWSRIERLELVSE